MSQSGTGNQTMQHMWRTVSRIARTSVFAAGALSITGAVAISSAVARKRNSSDLPSNLVLVIDFDGTRVVEQADTTLVSKLRLSDKQVQLSKITDALQHAGTDSRVVGLVSNLSNATGLQGLAAVQELRDAVQNFRMLKKGSVPSVAWADSFGEAGTLQDSGSLPYYLATAFDQIYVQPYGLVPFTGFMVSTTFMRGALDKWGIGFKQYSLEEYKSSQHRWRDKTFSKANREATQRLLDSYLSQVIRGVSTARGLTPEQVTSALHGSPLSPEDAASAGLVDGTKYKPDAMQTLLHSFEVGQSPAAVFAAKPAALVAAVVHAVAEQIRQTRVGEGTVQTVTSPDASVSDAAESHNPSGGHAVAAAVENADTQADSMVDRIQEANVMGRSHRQAAVVTDTGDSVNVTSAKLVSVQQYIQALEAEKWRRDRAGGIWELFQTFRLFVQGANEDDAEAISEGRPKVAVVTVTGQIQSGKPKPVEDGGSLMWGDQVAEDLQRARRDPAVKAVVMRVDTPGGSAKGSEAIWHEVRRMRHCGKPIIVSMGNYGTSGGYYISAPATKIVAQPGTVTGSIGVANAKWNISQPLEEQGVNVESISVGTNADMQSLFKDHTAAQEELVQDQVDQVYQSFMGKVAEGRGMSLGQVRKIAKGRIWSGEDALQRGLVDQLGGLSQAIQIAKQEAGLSQEEDAVDVVPFPPPKPLWQQLQDAMADQLKPPSFKMNMLLSALRLAETSGLLSVSSDNLLASAMLLAVSSQSGAHLGHSDSLSTLTAVTRANDQGLQLLCPPMHVR